MRISRAGCLLGTDYGDRCCSRVQGSGNLRLAVQLPEGEDTNEWLAVHGTSYLHRSQGIGYLNFNTAVDFFNHLNMLYGTVTEFCTPQEVRPRVQRSCDWFDDGYQLVSDYVCRSKVCPLGMWSVYPLGLTAGTDTNTSGKTASSSKDQLSSLLRNT